MRALAVILLVLVGCYQEPEPYPVGMTHTTMAELPHTAPGLTPSLRVSGDIVRTCEIKFHDVEIAPSFWFDSSALVPDDQDVLVQLARCMTDGALAHRALRLTAAPDDTAAVTARADAARQYLVRLGVAETRLSTAQLPPSHDAGVTHDGRVDIAAQSL